MADRILLSNAEMPGWTTERVSPHGTEQIRVDVYDPAGNFAGTVVYVRRKNRTGTGPGSVYGWRPAEPQNSRLSSKIDAVRRLPTVVAP